MKNLKNSICLFDVDGTLTEARKRIDKPMLDSLRELSFNTEIGLLTGSGLDYIKEQLWPLLADQELSLNCHILPCNGIEYYIPNPESPGNFIEIHKNSMWHKLGFEKFQFVMKMGSYRKKCGERRAPAVHSNGQNLWNQESSHP